jgi:hypothetical protein
MPSIGGAENAACFSYSSFFTSGPIRKFEATLTNCDQKTMDAFYYGNMADWLGLPR